MFKGIAKFLTEYSVGSLNYRRLPTGDWERLQIPATSVRLYVPNAAVTMARASGEVMISVMISSTNLLLDTSVDVYVAAPSNTSGVKLVSGGQAVKMTVLLTPAEHRKQVDVLAVRTANDNLVSGTLTYAIELRARRAIFIESSPQELYIAASL